MRVLSVNVGKFREVHYRGKPVQTAIYKEPVEDSVKVELLSIQGDVQADLRYHGGRDKAVYGYPAEHYAHWAAEEAVNAYPWGQFGENLTTEGLLEDAVQIGDLYRIGTAYLEVTQPRVPCYKLGIKMGSPAFVKKFLDSQRSGYYFRVIKEGRIRVGDAIDLVEHDPHGMTIQAIHTLHFRDQENRVELARAVALKGLSDDWRKELQALLDKLQE